MKTAPSIFGPPSNNSLRPPAAPIVGVDGRLWCPECRASVHRTRTPARCPECLQALIREAKPQAQARVTPGQLRATADGMQYGALMPCGAVYDEIRRAADQLDAAAGIK